MNPRRVYVHDGYIRISEPIIRDFSQRTLQFATVIPIFERYCFSQESHKIK